MTAISIPAVKVVRTGWSGLLRVEIPAEYWSAHEKLMQAAVQHGDYISIEYGTVHRPRTTGKKSQCNKLNGGCQIIAAETGQDFETVKWAVKCRAISRGYRYETDVDGHAVPISEGRASVEEASLLIETMQQLAAELEIKFPEAEG